MFKLLAKIKPLLKSLVVVGLIATLVFGNASNALAARTGGRIGGGSFSAPRTYTSPGGGYRAPAGGYGYGYGGGGGIGFPFLLPFFGFGGVGSLFTILIFIAIANFLIRSLRNVGGSSDSSDTYGYENPSVSIGKVQVGLLANARQLQHELDELAQSADTGTASGRAMVLQEASLALLRHPQYWIYGTTESQTAPLAIAEAKFNQLALTERSKFTAETLTNVNNQLRQASPTALLEGEAQSTSALTESREYIVVTLIAAVEGKLELPKVNDTEDLRRAVQQIGGLGSDRLLAVEILWTPQAPGDTLTTDDILAEYPNLKLV